MTHAKNKTIPALGSLFGVAMLVSANGTVSTAQTLIPAQAFQVLQVDKPAATGGTWTIEVKNTSQSVITAYGVALSCHYPDGTTKESGFTLDFGSLLAGRAGVLAEIEYLRSAGPKTGWSFSPGEDPTFRPGATRRDEFTPPSSVGGAAPDYVSAVPATVIMEGGRAAGDPDRLAVIFSVREEEAEKRRLLIGDLRAVDSSADPSATLEDRLKAAASAPLERTPKAKLVPGQTRVLLDDPEQQQKWRREQLLLQRRQAGTADHVGLKAAITLYQAEAEVYTRLAAYARQ